MSVFSRTACLRQLVCRTRRAHQWNLLRRVRLALRRMEYLQQRYQMEAEQGERDE